MLSYNHKAIFSILLLTLFCSSATAQTCKTYKFTSNATYAACIDLPVLNSFLHWSYTNTTKTLSIAFRHTNTSTSTWAAWAINPTSSGMIGSQAFVAVVNSNSSVTAYTSSVMQYATTLAQGDLSFPVKNVSGSFMNGEITILATLELPDSRTMVNQVWQSGPVVNGSPGRHLISGDNLKSKATLDVLSGQVAPTADPKIPEKKSGSQRFITNSNVIFISIFISFLFCSI